MRGLKEEEENSKSEGRLLTLHPTITTEFGSVF